MRPGGGSSSRPGADSVKVDGDALMLVADRDSLAEVLSQRFDRLPAMLSGVDRERRLVYMSPSFERLIEYKRDALIGSAMPFPWVAPEEVEKQKAQIQFLFSRKARDLGLRLVGQTLRSASGKTLSLWTHGRLIVNREGDTLGYLTQHMAQASIEAWQPDDAQRLDLLTEGLARVAAEVDHLARTARAHAEPGVSPAAATLLRLSRREREVVSSLCDGNRVPIIARRLGISSHTVRNHFKSIYRKLGIRSQMELLMRFRAPPGTA